MIDRQEMRDEREPLFSIARGSLPPAAWESTPSSLSAPDSAVRPEGPGDTVSADEPLHLRFERHARAFPEAPAAVLGDQVLSYGELARRADRLAQYLVGQGVTVETPVAVCLAPSLDLLVAMLAIFKAGGVYVPLDPTYPRRLLADVLAEVAPRLVLTDGQARPSLPAEDHRCVELDHALAVLPEADPAFCFRRVQLDEAAYVLYTSGTTGRPKGVVASHRNLAHYLSVAQRRFGFGRDDVFCSLARYTFSISFFELLGPLAAGASVVLLPRDEVLDPARLARVLDRVTVVHAGPSLLGSLFRHLRASSGTARTFTRVRHASTGGDLVPPRLLEELKQFFPRAELFVIYGCTEISCMGCSLPIRRARTETKHLVGKPFSDVALRLVDEHGRVAARGEVGEVYFAGKGVARRYLKQPALTSERFVSVDGQRFYRTGDLGRLDDEGNLELLGRSDFQVQVRGIRIELGGIEHTALELGLAAQCAVVAAQRDAHDVRLVAFVVAPRERELAGFRRALAERLPDYMLPQALFVLDALPLTPNGKLDRRRLVALAEHAGPSATVRRSIEPLAGSLEHAIAAAFARVLGVRDVGPSDDFFELGGHSLTAVVLLAELQNELGLSLSPGVLFAHPTVRALAQAAATSGEREQLPILLSERDSDPALFMLLGVHLYRELAQALAGELSVYGVYAARELSLLEGHAEAPSVAELAADYVAIIRRKQPHGPYRIGGMSFGGIVAYEVAKQLASAGEEIAAVVLLDAVLPETGLTKLKRLGGLPVRAGLSALARAVERRLGAKSTVPSEPPAHVDDAQMRMLDAQRQAAYHLAASAYLPTMRPFYGAVTLVVAGERLRRDALQDPACGFSRLVPNLSVHRVEAAHLALLEAPHVREVAELLRAATGLCRASERAEVDAARAAIPHRIAV